MGGSRLTHGQERGVKHVKGSVQRPPGWPVVHFFPAAALAGEEQRPPARLQRRAQSSRASDEDHKMHRHPLYERDGHVSRLAMSPRAPKSNRLVTMGASLG
jgi:hypothetical protein